MRQDNLEQHLQGYGDYFRGVSRESIPEGLSQPWQQQDWLAGWDAASNGVAVSHSAVTAAEEARAQAEAALAQLAAIQAESE